MAVFMDSDMLVRGDMSSLGEINLGYAVSVVKHSFEPKSLVKKENQVQQKYSRKNWSSMMVFNCDHPANKKLTVEMVNTLPGRDLHRFCWLEDNEIGGLSPRWNWLVGHSDPVLDPTIVHFTDGGPWLEEYKHVAYADEWHTERDRWLGLR